VQQPPQPQVALAPTSGFSRRTHLKERAEQLSIFLPQFPPSAQETLISLILTNQQFLADAA
jgi:hypothetical protein